MKKRFTVLLTLLLSSGLFAQGGARVSGVVTTNGEPLPGANVIVRGLSIGASTDVNGKYSFNIPDEYLNGKQAVLAAKYVGFKEKTVTIVLSQKDIVQDFDLEEDVFKSEEIVVTGLASKTSKAIAEVSVSKVDAVALTELTPYTSMNQLVGGKIAGVQMTQSSGNLGGGFRFQMRAGGGINGNGQPLIYIDGVRALNQEIEGFATGGQANSTLAGLNPEDIATFEILKGPAAAAMYGTDASNGVVLITTKKGQLAKGSGDQFNVEYKSLYGYNSQSYKYESSKIISDEIANSIYRDGLIRDNSVNIAGGTSGLRYFTSFSNRNEEGIVATNALNRTSMRANITALPSEKVKLDFNANYNVTDIKRPINDNSILGILGNTILYHGGWAWVDSAALVNVEDKTKAKQFVGSVQATYNPFKNLELGATVGLDNYSSRQDQTYPANFSYPTITAGQRSAYIYDNTQYTMTFNGMYKYELMSGLNGALNAGAQLFQKTNRSMFLETMTFASNLIKDIGAGEATNDKGESFTDSKQAGLFAENNFAYLDQYFLTLGMREDYASQMGQNEASIFYPKVSGAVRVDKFGFFPNESIGLFKVRAAYGESGQLPSITDGIPYLWSAGNFGVGAGAQIETVGNPDIKPETVTEFEVGFEMEFLQDYALDFTYYKQHAENSIVDIVTAKSNGYSSKPYNVGVVDGWGLETMLKANPIKTSDYQLDLSLIWNYQTNEVTDLGSKNQEIYGFGVCVIKEGYAKHEFYTNKVKGALFASNGAYVGVDAEAEKSSFGNPVPDHSGSFSFTFRFLKNFNLYVLTDWALNNKVLNSTRSYQITFGNDIECNKLVNQLDLVGNATYQNTPNDESVARLTPGTSEYIAAANALAKLDPNYDGNFIEDAAYFKIREISLGYNFTDLLSLSGANSYIKNVMAGISARNLLTISDYSGADPEVNVYGGSRTITRGVDFITMQNPTVYSMWVKLGL